MFCKNCGSQLDGNFCSGCGASCAQPAYQAGNNFAPAAGKSKIAAGLLAILVGLGIYNFYLGYTKKAVIQLMLNIAGIFIYAVGFVMMMVGAVAMADIDVVVGAFVAGIFFSVVGIIPLLIAGIWGLVEGIMILCGSIKVDGKGQPLV